MDKCKKCGGEDISISWHINKYKCFLPSLRETEREDEHLHYVCRTCEFVWTGDVQNREEAE